MKPVRCPNCDKKLAEHLDGGVLIGTCKCGEVVTIDRRIPAGIR